MEFFLYGFTGAILVIFLVFMGGLFGWKVRARYEKMQQRVTAEKLSETERQRLREEQEAWRALHSYSVEDAYGDLPKPVDPKKE